MILFWTILIWNVIVFLMYGIDKWRAKNDIWRIPEKVLLFSALLGGAIGASAGMITFHHKVSKPLFRFVIPLSLLLNFCAVLLFLIRY